jgi:hypothetical protein
MASDDPSISKEEDLIARGSERKDTKNNGRRNQRTTPRGCSEYMRYRHSVPTEIRSKVRILVGRSRGGERRESDAERKRRL